MARTLRRGLSALALLAVGGWLAAPVRAECVPFIGGWECDFKNEDTHLGLTQPGWKMISDDAIDQLIDDARSTMALYRSTTKTLGDGAIRDRLEAMEERVREALILSIAELARTAANDPFSLKPIYVDLTMCVPYWEVVRGGDCPTTPELVLDDNRVRELGELERELIALRLDPRLYLGEEWSAVGEDIETIKGEFDRLQTLGRNLGAQARLDRHTAVFSNYEAMLAGPRLTEERWQEERKEISATLNATLADTLGAAAVIGNAQLASDRSSLESVTTMNRNAIGRMQVMELSNMSDTQSLEAWTKITERLIHQGDAIALDMSEELHDDSRHDAERVRSLEQLPGVGTVVGNEAGARRFR